MLKEAVFSYCKPSLIRQLFCSTTKQKYTYVLRYTINFMFFSATKKIKNKSPLPMENRLGCNGNCNDSIDSNE